MKKLIFAVAVLVLLVGCARTIVLSDDAELERGPQNASNVTEPEAGAENKTVSPVSQEELDKLKADLEDLEAEDLGGLSE